MHKHDKDVHAAVHKPPPCQRLARGKFTIIAHVEQSPGTFVVKGRKKRNAHPVEYICDLKTKWSEGEKQTNKKNKEKFKSTITADISLTHGVFAHNTP